MAFHLTVPPSSLQSEGGHWSDSDVSHFFQMETEGTETMGHFSVELKE